jgi:hypothetical protein
LLKTIKIRECISAEDCVGKRTAMGLIGSKSTPFLKV